jgi:hypothetical protein
MDRCWSLVTVSQFGGSQFATRSPHTVAHLDLDGRVTLGDILRRPSQFMGASYADRVS